MQRDAETPAKRRRVRCKVASGKTPSTPTLLRWPSRWGLCGRCSHFDRTIHATPCQKCVWRHPAWKVIFGMRPNSNNATALLDAQQLPTVLLLSCWMRPNSTAMMSYALQCAPARFGAYCCRYAMNSSTLRLYPLGAVRGLPLESRRR